ncbi:B12-binding domain-containing radical SAM protein [Pseudomonas sp. ITEM 17296]|nr:B12-binding domain-containing radical SAM protein [Pseudomonas sp. ITEM 17296]
MLEFTLHPDRIEKLLNEALDELKHLEKKSLLSRGEQLRYRFALRAIGMKSSDVKDARDLMRDKDRFFDYQHYKQSVMILNRWMDILSLKGMPGQFDNFSMRSGYVLDFSSPSDLSNPELLELLASPFKEYWAEKFKSYLSGAKWDVVGISINYISQLPLALWMMRLIRQHSPSSLIIAGGTEITDIFKGVRNTTDLWQVFNDIDVLVVGEGESAFVDILNYVSEGRPIPVAAPGIFTKKSIRSTSGSYPVRYEDVNNLAEPEYSIWDYNKYWSPFPLFLFSPTRGCYWNRCTFCDYGLNQDSPTAPSRELKVATAVKQLQEISKITPFIYFAVDSMSPSYLRDLGAEIVDKGLTLKWSAELRLEPSFRKTLSRELRDAGCVSISFGFESASQRVLNLIDKGVKLAILPQILEELSANNIGVQMMGFIGFPGETPIESEETFNFLLKYRDKWALAGIGDFVLTPGAIIAKNPSKFGVTEIVDPAPSKIKRALYWKDSRGKIISPGEARSERVNSLSESLRVTPFDRPWLGGMDTAHSMMYFSRNGRRLLQSQEDISSLEIQSFIWHCHFPSIEQFTDTSDVAKARKLYSAKELLNDWLTKECDSGEADATSTTSIEIFLSGHYMTCDETIIRKEGKRTETFNLFKGILLRLHGLA